MLAPETGEYEIVVRTENSIKFFINDMVRPFIDAWVKSGSDTEFRGSIFLLAGHVYPIRLEYTKAKQGVDDSKEKKAKAPPVKGSIALEWKLPHRPVEVIPARFLSPRQVPRVVRPLDAVPARRPERRLRAWVVDLEGVGPGHDRGRPRGERLRRDPPQGAGRPGRTVEGPERAVKLRDFCRQVRRAGLPPPAQPPGRSRAKYVDRQFARGLATPRRPSSGRSSSSSSRRCSSTARSTASTPTTWPLGCRSASGIRRRTGRCSRPRPRRAAQRPRRTVVREASGWSTTPGTRAKVREFFLQWLRVEQVPDLSKDPSLYPGFDASVASDLRTSLDLFLDDVVWGDSSDFRQLIPGRLDLPQRPARHALRGRTAAGFAIPEGLARPRERAGCADASLPAGELRVHLDQLADSSGGVHRPEPAGPVAPAAARRGRSRWLPTSTPE